MKASHNLENEPPFFAFEIELEMLPGKVSTPW
jgi:hypothetical protein